MGTGETRNSGGDGEAQGFMREPTSPPSPVRRIGETVINFPSPAAFAGAREDAGVSSASASSFIPLGIAAHAVVLRLQGGFPKIRVRGAAEGGEQAAPLDDQREGKPR
ncbi:hypothetical protein NN6n1_12990 [Shinella zoogloeoides]